MLGFGLGIIKMRTISTVGGFLRLVRRHFGTRIVGRLVILKDESARKKWKAESE